MPQPLSSKEQSLFRTVVRNYEDKQYKKGLKAAEQILKKNPKHGDTMAMKALILNSMGKSDEAFPLAKLALQSDMKSHVCWHVYGLLYRAEKNFEEAIKAYKFALRLDPESQQILRDLALLQVQMRDYQGYVVSRRQMLQSRSHIRQNWTGLAIAHHLAGNLSEAESTLTTYEETLKSPPSKTDLENSEAILYKNTIIAEQGDIEKALDHLQTAGKHALDRLAFTELRAKYFAKLGRKEEAVKAYRVLLDRNPEHKEYYDQLLAVMDIDLSDHKAVKAIYDEYAEKYPRSDSARRLPLDHLEGDDFRTAAELYVHKQLDKDIPSLFVNLKHLYSNSSKKDILLSIVNAYLEKTEKTGDEQTQANGTPPSGKAAAYYYLAQHYNYHLSRDLAKAMEYVEKAIELEPKSVDFHMTKARIWKHYGNLKKASETMEEARALDPRDRYINTKSAKYKLRNDETEAAIKTLGMFTRAEAVGGPLADLHDMQCVWFLTEDGESYARQRKYGLALKRFTAVFNVFDVWQEDQFDFHSFSLRKGQIRAYVDMIRWEERLRDDPFYSRAALAAVKVYLKLHDKPLSNGVNGDAHADQEAAIEKKKAAKKARKEAEKAAQEAAAKKEPNKPVKESDAAPKKVDDDPEGVKLAATADPLHDAMKFLNPLLEFSPKTIAVQIAGAEVLIRRNKLVQALRCLLDASKIDASHPQVHELSIRFKLAFEAASSSLSPKVAEAIKAEFNILPESVDLRQYNKTYLSEHKDSPLHVHAALRATKYLGNLDEQKAEQAVLETLESPRITLEEALEGLELLTALGCKTASYREEAHSKWPEATTFEA